MKINETIKMNNGLSIPVLGVGLWQVSKEDAARVVKEGIELGYRHLDDAAAYRNEEEAGEGIRASGIAREELFVTTKIPAEFKSYEKAKQSIDDSLRRLGLEYLDLILIHAPRPWPLMWTKVNYDKQNVEVYRAMEEALEEGKVRAIGVSNFSEHDIDNILAHCKVKPAVNQICVFAGNTPK
ncbi:MAG: aldo/keto reductase, partial [Bacilli bacterium]|nr:aldo/keto reductase [Bacilli bacterium]